MSQEKAQLIAPLGVLAVDGVTASGVITASSFTGNVVGSAKSLVNGSNVTVGVMTATSFDGNLTGNIQRLADSGPNINVGVTTATSFVGNLTGSVTDLTSAPAITVGMVTATTLEGPVTGNITGNISGLAGGLGVNYNGGWTGAGTSQIKAGVVTATTFYGDGSNLDGVSSGPVSQQSIGITSAATAIDLSNGNMVYANQSANTTVSFANTANGNVYFVRAKDSNTTARTITWPDRIKWDGGTAPTLISDSSAGDAQVFLLVTRDMGVTWYGKEVVNYDLQAGGTPFRWFGWGKNASGHLGHNNETNYSSPVQIPGTTWSGVAGRLAVKTDGTLWATGQAGDGQMGRNSTSPGNFSSPTQVGTDTNWGTSSKKIAGGERGSLAIKNNGTLWAWGVGTNGQLGLNDIVQRSSPTQVGTDNNWNDVTVSKEAGNTYLGYGIKTDSTLWSWGENYYGQLGQNQSPSVDVSSPVQIPGEWSQLSAGMDHVIAVKTNGTLWSWGNGDFGKTGHNNVGVTYSSPKQVGSDTNWSQASGGTYGSAAVKSNGELYVWGANGGGQIGVNDRTQYSSPKQVSGTTWQSVTIGDPGTVHATKTDGTWWSWGYNNSGQLGHNNTTKYSSPVQLTGTDWVNKVKKGFDPVGQRRSAYGAKSV
jgi:alpha-tubulin suppressor-like RCC1 family protein|tara:strand:- start:234 stop:2180 length:1947 start_codon:yes stop_codon:yes gene_type:complete